MFLLFLGLAWQNESECKHNEEEEKEEEEEMEKKEEEEKRKKRWQKLLIYGRGEREIENLCV
jgi:flagellar biosynthesis component FlhA